MPQAAAVVFTFIQTAAFVEIQLTGTLTCTDKRVINFYENSQLHCRRFSLMKRFMFVAAWKCTITWQPIPFVSLLIDSATKLLPVHRKTISPVLQEWTRISSRCFVLTFSIPRRHWPSLEQLKQNLIRYTTNGIDFLMECSERSALIYASAFVNLFRLHFKLY